MFSVEFSSKRDDWMLLADDSAEMEGAVIFGISFNEAKELSVSIIKSDTNFQLYVFYNFMNFVTCGRFCNGRK